MKIHKFWYIIIKKLKNSTGMKKIYFDCAATTPIDSTVKKAMLPYFSEKFGNPSSLHSFGQEVMAAIDDSREKIARSIGANFHEIIFTGSATEANNLALRGAMKFFNNQKIENDVELLTIPPRI